MLPSCARLASRGRLSLHGSWRLQTKVRRVPYDMVMRKLAAVEEARAVMTEGMEWGVWTWLLEKSRVQEIADRATAALHEADRKVKAAWSDELKTAYKELVEQEKPKRGRRQEKDPEGVNIAAEVRLKAKKVKQAYDEGQRARVDAEDTFEEAERRMSTDLAREGARKALESYDLREHAIRKAEAAGGRTTSGGKV